MVTWKYKIKSGVALREAIDNDDLEQTVKCLLSCCVELNRRLRGEDKSNYALELDEMFDALDGWDIDEDEEENEYLIDTYLERFYDICDDVRAWIEI